MGEEINLSLDRFKLPLHYVELLKRLIEEGKGYAKLDRFGRIVVGPTASILGDPVTWLKLCAFGCIIGREDRLGEIEITPLGTSLVEEAGGRRASPVSKRGL